MARRSTIPRPAKKIHTLRWAGDNLNLLAQAAGSTAGAVLGAGSPAETILRTRGWFQAWLDGAQAPGVTVLVSAGLILVPEGQGSTVIWDPFNDANAPWMWYTEFVLGYEEMVTDVVGIPGMMSARIEVDGKAMRKGSPDEELQLVVTNTTLGIASSINSALTGRVLLGH